MRFAQLCTAAADGKPTMGSFSALTYILLPAGAVEVALTGSVRNEWFLSGKPFCGVPEGNLQFSRTLSKKL